MIDEKLKDDEDLLDSYDGKWCIFCLLKDSRSGMGSIRYDKKTDVQKDITKIWKGMGRLTYNDRSPIPIDKIFMLSPMPVKD